MSGTTSQRDPKDRAPRSRADRLRVLKSEEGVGQQLFLVRHGQTSLNAAGVLRGRLDPELDVTGLMEALEVAAAIGRSGLKLVVASPLRRAVETAGHIATRAGVPLETDDRLIDRDYGTWAGKPKADLISRWGSLDGAPDVEPAADVFARAMDAFLDVANRVGSGTAAIVTHDAVLQLLLPALDPRLEQDEPIPQATGCFDVVEALGDGWQVTQLNVSPAASGTNSEKRTDE
jgi:broad specificity phosphatase PhoE